ncbi:hypothetical protein YC2023_094726 [Brassica napus]
MIIPYGGTETGVSYILLSLHTILQETWVEDLASVALHLMSANQKEGTCLPDRAFLFYLFHLAEIENSQNHTDAVLLRHQNTTTLFLQISSERTTNLANHQICNMHNTPRSHASSSMERSDRSKGKRLSEYSKPKSPTHHSDSASRSSLKLHGTSVTS